MKKILLSVFVLGTFLSNAQTFVSTTPENKNVILEEFTGISCGYCPDGHAIGQALHDANPNDVFLINIHTGGYATPQGPGTDFNTSFGSAIASQSGLSGYPAGTVNRHQFSMTQGGGTAMSRGDWGSAASQILAETSPVNVGIQASVDMATNTLTVDVEVYYTGTQTVSSNKLNVAIVQNGILGPQSGGASYNPSAIDPATGLYTHQHMLRHMLTSQWGETISNISPGTLYTYTDTWTIPNQITGYPQSPTIDPTNIAIVAFVSEGQQEILSGTEVYPSLVFANAYDANLINVSSTNIMCTPTTDLTIDFKNYGNTNLTSLDIDYSINGGTSTTYPWTGNLGPGASETVTIPQISVTPIATNSVDVTLSNPNGNTDQNTANNYLSGSFEGMYNATAGQVSIDVTTDNYPSETTWKLQENGITIATGGPYSSGGAPQTTAYATITPGNCYTFIMEDSYGDGLLSPGNYKVKDANNGTIVWGGTNSPNGNFTTEELTYFESNSGVAPSWDCDGQGNCQDPGDGSGQYNSLSSCQSACVATSIDNQDTESITIFPNPVKEQLTIKGQIESVEIYDAFGKLVLTSTKNTINTRSLSNGIYIVSIKSNDLTTTKRITVTK